MDGFNPSIQGLERFPKEIRLQEVIKPSSNKSLYFCTDSEPVRQPVNGKEVRCKLRVLWWNEVINENGRVCIDFVMISNILACCGFT